MCKRGRFHPLDCDCPEPTVAGTTTEVYEFKADPARELERLRIVVGAVVELTKAKLLQVPHVCVENFVRDAFKSLWQESAKANDAEGYYSKLYHELVYAVERKHVGESRHQTALRYIQEAEAAARVGATASEPCVIT